MASSPPTNLIILCCHAIYLRGRTRGRSEDEWLLAPFQTGETPTFTAHIRAGLSLLSASPSSLLVFSGGKTKREVEKSEARSYLDLCIDNEFWGLLGGDGVAERILLEEWALDSFGNLVLGVLRFWRATGSWPEMVTIASHEFKRARFLDLHVKAMRLPRKRVEFLGIDPMYMDEGSVEWDEERASEVKNGESEKGYKAWEQDLLGRGKSLGRKRRERDCWGKKNKGKMLFESDEERTRSGVKSDIFEAEDGYVEEVLNDEKQPWES